jgi:hypothetical protein
MKTSIFILIAFLMAIPFHSISKTAKWTVLVYMNADNNLESDGIDDFLEMAQASDSEDINILVQFDRAPDYSSAYGDWTQTLRFKIKNGMEPYKENAIDDLKEQNMGDPTVLRKFVDWGKDRFPAEHYIIILWGHGSGYRYKNMSLVNDQMLAAYVNEYNQAQISINSATKIVVAKERALYSAKIAKFRREENTTVGKLNILSQQTSLLPSDFMSKLNLHTN